MSDRASGRLGVGVVGAGRVGPVLGAALAGAGHALVGITAVSEAGRERAEALLPGAPILRTPELVERSELVLLAVPGEELEGLVAGLASAGIWRPGQIVAHTHAAHGIGVLEPALRAGAIPLALHPAMVFTGTSLDLSRLRECYMAVTAPAVVQPIGQALVVEMGAEPIVIAEEDRAAYAEAVGIASEFSTAIVEQATGLLAGIGVAGPGRVLGGLVRSAVDAALARAAGGEELPAAPIVPGPGGAERTVDPEDPDPEDPDGPAPRSAG